MIKQATRVSVVEQRGALSEMVVLALPPIGKAYMAFDKFESQKEALRKFSEKYGRLPETIIQDVRTGHLYLGPVVSQTEA